MQNATDSFERFHKAWAEGRIKVGVHRDLARRFFTHQGLNEIETNISARPLRAWAAVRVAALGAPLALFAAIALGTLVLPWWSSLVVLPAALAGYLTYQTSSRNADADLIGISAVLVLSILISILVPGARGSVTERLISLYLLSLWSLRFSYVFATHVLRGLVLANPRAYESLMGTIVVQRSGSDPT